MMKAWLRVMAVVMMLAIVGSGAKAEGEIRGYTAQDGYVYVTLGRYPQSIEGGEPEKMSWKWSRNKIKDPSSVDVSIDPILWRVLTVDDEKAYLCSEYVLFASPMHTNVKEYKKFGGDFAKTQLCAYLNGEFASEAFTEDEMDLLIPCGDYGKVFLLDSTDVKDKTIGMGNGAMKAWGTEYAIRVTGSFVYQTSMGSSSPYWVRNPSTSDPRHARCTKQDGSLGHLIADRDNESARPAVYLDMSAYAIAGGSGTKTDPYQIVKKEAE